MTSWIKPVLISTGFVAIGMHLKVIVPVAVDFSQAPILLSAFLSWLKPPYLYVITNVIIIVIVGSSKYYRCIAGKDEEVSYCGENKFHTEQQILHRRRSETKDVDLNANFSFITAILPTIIAPEVVTEAAAVVVEEEKRCLAVVVAESENLTPVEKPLVSARIGQRKLVKTTTAERNSLKALRVAKPRRNETMENTWKLITEGKPPPLTSHYRRPDTFGLGDGDSNETTTLKKSEKFKDRSKFYLSPAVSRSRDELNRRAEAFIKKCNEERFESMRLDKEVVVVAHSRRGLSF